MKIVFVSRWFSENMGYIENCLPGALASLGHEVHLITTTAQVYATEDFYEKSYKKFLGAPFLEPGVYQSNGVTIHRLPFRMYKSQLLIRGLNKLIRQLKPDVVQVFEHGGFDSLKVGFLALFSRFRFFSGNHTVYSVFPQVKNWDQQSGWMRFKVRLRYAWPGNFLSLTVRKCFCVTDDAGEIAIRFFAVPQKKVVVSTLGTDTHIFHPVQSDQEKEQWLRLRQELGFSEDDIVCFYSGRLTAQKNPLITARAISSLVKEGHSIKYLVIGEGEQAAEIESFPFVKRINLQPYRTLPDYYRVADIAVWPVEESTSQLDAVASGCCLVLTNKIQAYAHVSATSGNKPRIVSSFFKRDDEDSLTEVLRSLLPEAERRRLSDESLLQINEHNAWHIKALERLKYYNQA